MKIFLGKFKVFAAVLLTFVFYGNVEAQCTITTTTNASTLNSANICSTFSGCTTVYVGDGSTSMTLTLNEGLNFTCLGAINFIITNNATIVFGNSANDKLTLGEGSSITVNVGGSLSGGNNCTSSDRIVIGSNLVSTCDGNAGTDVSFPDIMNLGGTGSATSNSPVCVGNTINLSATPPPNGGPYTYLWSGPNGFSSTSQIPAAFSATTTPNTAGLYSVSMTSTTLSSNKTVVAQTTVDVNLGSTTAAPTVTITQPTCTVSIGTITITAPTGMKYSINGLTYTTSTSYIVAPGTYSVTAKNSSGCISNATSVVINTQPLSPAAPTGSSSQSFCSGATVASLVATGTVIQWYAASSGGSALATNTVLVNGTHYYASQTSGCESSSRFDVTVTVSNSVDWANLQWPPSGNICEGGSLTAFGQVYQAGVTPGNGLQGAGITVEFGYATSNTNPNTWTNWTVASFNAFGGGDNNDEYQYTFTPLSSGTYYYTFRYRSGSCNWQYGGHVLNAGGFWDGTTNISGVLTVNPIPSTPSTGIPTQPDCITPTGSVVLSGLPSSGTINQTGTVVASYSITGTTMTIPGLAVGTYNFTVNNGSCTSAVTGNVVINTAVTNTWNGISWSNGVPNSTQKIIFTGNYPPTPDPNVDITACSCQVNAGVYVNINSGHTLTLTNELTAAPTASMTFFNNASLVQINNVANSGDIDYVRTTNTVVRNTDYTYWSSPVSPQTLGDFSPDTPDGMMYSYNSSIEDWKQEYLSTTMNPGIGYIVRGPEPSGIPVPPAPYTASFVGVPNNGTINIPIVYSGAVDGTSNLLGNPYPSALDADTFLFDNAGVLEGTIYFWTHNTQIGIGVSDPGTGAYAYSGDDYASYNSVGGVGVGSASLSGSTVPTGKISAGQGFFATSIATGTVTFNNNMRVAGNNSQFFKTKSSKKTAIEKNRVWLNLTNTQGAFKQTLIGYVTNATNDYDSRFDGESFDGNEFVDFYSVNQEKNLVIQGRALPFDENDEVPLGFRTTINGDFTINIDQVDGSLTNQAVYIEDKLTNTVFDLKRGNYTFNTVAGTFNDRFVLRYTNTNKTLATKNFDSLENKVLVSNKNKQIKIYSFAETIDKVEVYDLLGRQAYQNDNVNSNELSIANLLPGHQTLIVKTRLQNGETVTDKIIY